MTARVVPGPLFELRNVQVNDAHSRRPFTPTELPSKIIGLSPGILPVLQTSEPHRHAWWIIFAPSLGRLPRPCRSSPWSSILRD